MAVGRTDKRIELQPAVVTTIAGIESRTAALVPRRNVHRPAAVTMR